MNARIAGVVMAALLAAACGSGSDATAPEGDAGADGSVAPAPRAASGGPDLNLARERLLLNANLTVPNAARLVSFTENKRDVDGPSVIVHYDAELEFVADTYFHDEHKAGERHKVYGEAEYFNEAGNWTLVALGVYPR